MIGGSTHGEPYFSCGLFSDWDSSRTPFALLILLLRFRRAIEKPAGSLNWKIGFAAASPGPPNEKAGLTGVFAGFVSSALGALLNEKTVLGRHRRPVMPEMEKTVWDASSG
jgi:hypothetical protein